MNISYNNCTIMISAVTIIIPSYNKKNYITECINSVINQTYANWKLMIIDDCSTDGTQEILKEFLNNKKIEIFFLKKNKGPSFCRNIGMRKSNSKYIAFLDADDFWERSKLEDQVYFMEKNNIKLSFSDYFTFRGREVIQRTNIKSELNYSDFIMNSSINTSTMMIEKKIIGSNKFKKLNLLEDYIFKCEILKKGYIAKKFNKCLAAYRLTETNRSSNRLKNLVSLWVVNKKYNKLNFFCNLISIINISINSVKKYKLKKYI